MTQFPSGPMSPVSRTRPLDAAEGRDVLVSFFNAVYAWMASGLALTALVAWFVSREPAWMKQIFNPIMLIVLVLAQLGLVVVISAAVNRVSATVATGLFLLYSALTGLTLSSIFIVYTQASIVSAFAVSAGMFGAMSLYGMVTRRDLTKLGSLLFMALIGLLLATVVNIFWANQTLYWIITYAGVLIFVGLTAYDTQKLKAIAHATAGNPEMSNRMAISGSLMLYLDFINIFLFMLRIMGSRK